MTETKAVTIRPSQELDRGVPTEITRMLTLAIEKGVSAGDLEKLILMGERVSDRAAAQEFAQAMSDFQHDCPPIPRTSTANIVTQQGAKFSYKYAELDEIARTIVPLLSAHGLSFTWDSTADKNLLCCTCTLRHVNGHKITASFTAPTDSKAGMSEGQKVAAALTFARRQSLVQVLGLTTTDADTDGREPGDTERISEKQIADLEAMLDEIKWATRTKAEGRASFLKYLKVERMEDITGAGYKSALAFAESKRRSS